MSDQKPLSIPPASALCFERGIAHPDLWLWDSWTTEANGELHLYILAMNRFEMSGASTLPDNRNDYPFHIRHFVSADGGESWRDEGAFLTPEAVGDGAFARNVWSGCMVARETGGWLCGFTGIRELGAERPFLQTICIGESEDGSTMDRPPVEALSCPLRDYEMILEAGYYLPPRDELGAQSGEEGGPILAWRDPFIVETGADILEVFWSAKIGPARPAVAHATVRFVEGRGAIETLHPPMTLPDGAGITQAEVPKLYPDRSTGEWYMLISACDRLNENQPAEEVSKNLRLYRSDSLRGPWRPAFAESRTVVEGADLLFGASIINPDFANGRFSLLGPYTEYASETRQLTFAPILNLRMPAE